MYSPFQIPGLAKFWTWQGSQYASVTQCSEYARICLDKVLNISRVLNMPEFWIGQGSEYAAIWLNMSEFTITNRVLNSILGHSKSELVLIERWSSSEPFQRSKVERFGKIIIAFNYFSKTLYVKSLRGFWICAGF